MGQRHKQRSTHRAREALREQVRRAHRKLLAQHRDVRDRVTWQGAYELPDLMTIVLAPEPWRGVGCAWCRVDRYDPISGRCRRCNQPQQPAGRIGNATARAFCSLPDEWAEGARLPMFGAPEEATVPRISVAVMLVDQALREDRHARIMEVAKWAEQNGRSWLTSDREVMRRVEAAASRPPTDAVHLPDGWTVATGEG